MQNVDFLFRHWKEMDQAYAEFSKLSKLSCPKNCSSCCEDHHVHTSSFEMLPAALRLLKEGKTDETLEAIDGLSANHCALVKNHRCSVYEERPSMCRLFGMGRIENKTEDKETYSICKIIKKNNADSIRDLEKVKELKNIKSFSQLYMPLVTQIPQGEAEELPINEALKKAIEKVLLYSSYQKDS